MLILELGRQMWVDQEPKASPHYIESSTTKTHMTWAKLCNLGQTNKPIAGIWALLLWNKPPSGVLLV